MKIQEAKENIMKNFRANYTNDHQSTHDIEIFLLNTLEQFESIVRKEVDLNTQERENAIKNLERDYIKSIIRKWKNEGDNPTEADLVLENILKSI